MVHIPAVTGGVNFYHALSFAKRPSLNFSRDYFILSNTLIDKEPAASEIRARGRRP